MKAIRNFIFSLAVAALIVVCIGQYCALAHKKRPAVIYIQDPNYVQNIGEAQQRLKEQGLYHGKIDYIWGPLMDKAYGNWCGIREVEGR